MLIYFCTSRLHFGTPIRLNLTTRTFPKKHPQTSEYTRWPFPPISAWKVFPAEALCPNHQWGRLAPSLLSNYGLPPDNTPRIQIRIGESGRRPRADQSVTAPGIDMWTRSSHAILNRFPRAIFVNRTFERRFDWDVICESRLRNGCGFFICRKFGKGNTLPVLAVFY